MESHTSSWPEEENSHQGMIYLMEWHVNSFLPCLMDNTTVLLVLLFFLALNSYRV